MRVALRILLAPAFGIAMALCFAAGWFLVDRGFTVRSSYALSFLAVSGTVSAGVAEAAARILARAAWSARFAAAFIILAAGTVALASIIMMIQVVFTHHDMREVPVAMAVRIMAINSAAAFHNMLALAAPLMLPLALPLVVVFAGIIAGRAR